MLLVRWIEGYLMESALQTIHESLVLGFLKSPGIKTAIVHIFKALATLMYPSGQRMVHPEEVGESIQPMVLSPLDSESRSSGALLDH